MELSIVFVFYFISAVAGTVIHIQFPWGTQHTAYALPTNTILDVKTYIFNLEGVPIEMQMLSYNGQEMEDQNNLGDYNVPNNADIDVTIVGTGWTEWGSWGRCSEDCGYGIRIKTRMCLGGDPGDEACEGEFYLVQTCDEGPCPAPGNTDEDVADRKAQMVCDLLAGVSPVYGYGKEIRVGNCNDVCADNGKNCHRAFKLYPNPERRLDKELTQVFTYPNCATVHSNTCCCVGAST